MTFVGHVVGIVPRRRFCLGPGVVRQGVQGGVVYGDILELARYRYSTFHLIWYVTIFDGMWIMTSGSIGKRDAEIDSTYVAASAFALRETEHESSTRRSPVFFFRRGRVDVHLERM